MNNPKDSDLREALRRMYADTPELPSDFLTKMHQAEEKKDRKKALRRWLYPISIGAVAASLLLLLTFHYREDRPKEQPLVAKQTVAQDDSPSAEEDKTTATIEEETDVAEPEAIKPMPKKKPRKRHRMTKPVNQTAVPQLATTEKGISDPLPPGKSYNRTSLPDPYVMAAMQAQDIRTRGERLHQEIAQLNEITK